MTAHRTHIFGIVNITEDSFSDGGQFLNPEAAIAHAAHLLAAGADVLVAGSAVFKGGSAAEPAAYGDNIRAIRAATGDL